MYIYIYPQSFSLKPRSQVEIVDSDCLSWAVELARRGEDRKPTVLNMANPDHPGGGLRYMMLMAS